MVEGVICFGEKVLGTFIVCRLEDGGEQLNIQLEKDRKISDLIELANDVGQPLTLFPVSPRDD